MVYMGLNDLNATITYAVLLPTVIKFPIVFVIGTVTIGSNIISH